MRRVILDIVVTDSHGKPVRGLTKNDFSVAEDGHPQEILSFDVHDLDSVFTPPRLPALPPNTFVNVPSAAERGPLYVLLLDLVNTQIVDQMIARQQLLKFLNDKPAGTRFAIFVLSDTLRLIQGFTDDKNQLFAAADPKHPKSHIPRVFLYGNNYGRGNPFLMISVFTQIAQYLDGLPGRKNLIWFSGAFPMQMFPKYDDPPDLQDDVRRAIETLVEAEISVYPVDVRGVIVGESLTFAGPVRYGSTGFSALPAEYQNIEEIAGITGGQAFYSTNDLKTALADATEIGGNFYTITYAPSNEIYNGNLRTIRVELSKKGYQLAYRHSYFAEDPDSLPPPKNVRSSDVAEEPPPRKVGDSLYANMEHGAPLAHQIYFKAHIRTIGPPALATPAQMADLSDKPAYFRVRHKNRPLKPLPPVQLLAYAIDYALATETEPDAQGHKVRPPNVEIAAAAFNADGQMLNGVVGETDPANAPSIGKSTNGIYRVEQQIEVPVSATSIRIAIRDISTDRIGAMEIALPLAPGPLTTASTP